MAAAATKNPVLPPQAIIRDRDTYFAARGMAVNLAAATKSSATSTVMGPIVILLVMLAVAINVVLQFLAHAHH